jgi:hypothetical protein
VVERLEGMPDGTIGFRVDGDVEREDYTDLLVPELRRAVKGGGDQVAGLDNNIARSPVRVRSRGGGPCPRIARTAHAAC